MDLASSPGFTSPSKAVWDLVMRASKAWSSQDPEGVASCYEPTASLTINRGIPSTGRAELAATAASYMQAFPDLQVSVDHVLVAGDSVFWVWTLTGTNNGPAGTGNRVRVSGIEVWTMGASGLVANSIGYYDANTYERQIAHGIEEGVREIAASTETGHFEESEIVTALQSLVSILEDPDPKKRAYAYTQDATFVMPGVPPVHGRGEMLQRLETGIVLHSVTITPYSIEGRGDLAYADGLFTCLTDPTEASPGGPVRLVFLMVWRKESDGVWRIAREFLSAEAPTNQG
jgi:uncharacterized protein (TIGR02246 family)